MVAAIVKSILNDARLHYRSRFALLGVATDAGAFSWPVGQERVETAYTEFIGRHLLAGRGET